MPKHKKSRLFSSGDIELSSLDTLLCFCFGGDEKNVKKCNLLCSPSPGVFFSSEGKTVTYLTSLSAHCEDLRML